jgi:hypothetical protein
MTRHKPAKPSKITPASDLNQQGANALLAATFQFLRRNNISKKSILEFTRKHPTRNQLDRNSRIYKELELAQENMGRIMGTWFSHPKFLDASGRPRPLTAGKGANSIAHLVRVSGAQIQGAVAVQFMRQSPYIKCTSDGQLIALKRVFVLPKLLVPRAAFVVERYLETVLQIASDRKKDAQLLLERSCHVSEVDLAKIIPILRDIESRGAAFMDSIDGDLEGRRLRKSKRKSVGELGVHVFVWTKSSNGRSKTGKNTTIGSSPTKPLVTSLQTKLGES